VTLLLSFGIVEQGSASSGFLHRGIFEKWCVKGTSQDALISATGEVLLLVAVMLLLVSDRVFVCSFL
jgi:hypothetical protein